MGARTEEVIQVLSLGSLGGLALHGHVSLTTGPSSP